MNLSPGWSSLCADALRAATAKSRKSGLQHRNSMPGVVDQVRNGSYATARKRFPSVAVL